MLYFLLLHYIVDVQIREENGAKGDVRDVIVNEGASDDDDQVNIGNR